MVGGSSALVYVIVTTMLVGLPSGVPDWMLSALCYAALVLPTYLLHRRFSFRSGASHRQALPRYIAVQVLGVLLAATFSFIAYGLLGQAPFVASVLVAGLTAAATFLIMRLWAFAET